MPIAPLRNLGKMGVITDVNDYDLPNEAVSAGRNVRFADGRITSFNVWRTMFSSSLAKATPVFTFTIESPTTFDKIGYVAKDGSIVHITNGVEADVTKVGYATSSSTAQRSFCHLQGVNYINQEDRVPWAFTPGATNYVNLANWTSTDRCKVLRSYKDYLIALNVTKSGTVYPNLVKWSDIAQYGAVPSSWDPADTTKSAGENTLSEIRSAIYDGMALRNVFQIYAKDQVWAMAATGGPDVFQFEKSFDRRGIINTNCVVEVNGVHFVFDDDDIYTYDGASVPQSICDKRVRKYIFRDLDQSKSDICFTYHDVAAREVWFCHNSKKTDLKWSASACDYCNFAAVYNYVDDTWTFIDLPNISSMTTASYAINPTYATTVNTYEDIGASYSDLEGNKTRGNFGASCIATGITSDRIVNADNAISYSFGLSGVSELVLEEWAQRTGIDFDDILPDLRSYKNLRASMPQVYSEDSVVVQFRFGGSDGQNSNYEWEDYQAFAPNDGDYKIDTRARGRYLGWSFKAENQPGYYLSGFDLDLLSLSRR